jgi:hypothetical protein
VENTPSIINHDVGSLAVDEVGYSPKTARRLSARRPCVRSRPVPGGASGYVLGASTSPIMATHSQQIAVSGRNRRGRRLSQKAQR